MGGNIPVFAVFVIEVHMDRRNNACWTASSAQAAFFK